MLSKKNQHLREIEMHNMIDLAFPVKGTALDADHNYFLYSAICQEFPALHDLPNLAINTISGMPDRQGKILLTPHSKLWMRLPVENISHIYQLAGKKLRIGKYSVELGNPTLQSLQPVDSLKARIVTIKGYTEPIPFLEAVKRQLSALEIKDGELGIPANHQGIPKRLTLKIKKPNKTYSIVGYSVLLTNLSPEDSLKLQCSGLGGKRRLGCGVFYPAVKISTEKGGNRHDETIAG